VDNWRLIGRLIRVFDAASFSSSYRVDAGGLVLYVLWAIWWIFAYYNTTICQYPFGLLE
jgi:hypothetical protein